MAAALVVELDQMELACRIAEAQLGRKRPIDATAAEAMALIAAIDRGSHDGLLRAAEAAIFYLKDRVDAGSKVN